MLEAAVQICESVEPTSYTLESIVRRDAQTLVLLQFGSLCSCCVQSFSEQLI